MTAPVDPAPWLPLPTVLAHVGVDAGSAQELDADRARLAAAAYVERTRPDLLKGYDDNGDGTIDRYVYEPTRDVAHAGLLLAARLFARRGTPQGLASFGEFGPGAILRLDPDVERLLGVGRHARPRVG